MKAVLQQERTQDEYYSPFEPRFPQTIVTKKTQSDFKNYHDDPLGHTKNLA